MKLVSLDAGSCIRRFSTDKVRTASFARISDISYIPNALAVKLNTLLKLEKLTKQIKSVAVIEHYLGTVFADKSACWVLISELNLEVPFHYKIQS